MAASMVHVTNLTPGSATLIMGFSTLTLEHPGDVPPAITEFQKAIIASAESMHTLIKQSMDYSTIQRKLREKKRYTGLPSNSGSYDASHVPLPPMVGLALFTTLFCSQNTS
jgi:hypothetical protein